MTDTIDEKVRHILHEHLGTKAASEIKGDDKILDDLGADSLDIIELVMACEEEFDIEVSDDVTDTVVTVADLVAAVKKIKG